MCAWLKVSTSGFYHWASRPQSATAARRQVLTTRVRHFFAATDGTYGYRRIHADLVDEGSECSPELVRHIMRDEGLVPCQPRPFRVTTEADAAAAAGMPDLVDRDFTAERPGIKFVGDITYIPTDEGWLYLAVVEDLYSRKVVGWAMSAHIDAPLVVAALEMALEQERPHAGLSVHSDRGSQYCSDAMQEILAREGITVSMSRRGNCWDNAPMESCWGSLKTELVHHRRFATREQAKREITEYIEIFYNRIRKQARLGHLSPAAFSQQYYAMQMVA